MKKILFLIHALNPAGAQKVLIDMVNNLDPEKFDITVQTMYDRGSLKKELNDNVHYKTIIKTKNKFLFAVLSYLFRRVLNPSWIAKHFIGDEYDYEIAYLEGECTRLIAHNDYPDNKKIAWVHTNMKEVFVTQGLYKTLEDHSNVYKRFDKIICVSDAARTGFYERFGHWNNVGVLYNVVNAELIEKKAEESVEYEYRSCLNILMVGNCRPEKSYDRMFRVCNRLKQAGMKFHVTIIGNGSEKSNLDRLVFDLNLSDCVSMLGEKKNPYPYMKKADVLVCSSIQEGFSTVVIEACILGLPVLTTDCAGMSEILDNGRYGIIVQNTEEALFEGLKNLILNPGILEKYRTLLPERSSFFKKETRINEIEKLFT